MRHVVHRADEGRRADKDLKPLSEAVLWILLALSERPRHGYALMGKVEHASAGRVRLSTGTLYGALRRLLEDGWIERFELADTSREKQGYRPTALGRTQLRQELDRLAHVTRTAARLKLKAV